MRVFTAFARTEIQERKNRNRGTAAPPFDVREGHVVVQGDGTRWVGYARGACER